MITLTRIIDWVVKNKEWLFSGVGVVVVVGILSWLSRRRLPFKSDQPVVEREKPTFEYVPKKASVVEYFRAEVATPAQVARVDNTPPKITHADSRPLDLSVYVTRPFPEEITETIKSAAVIRQAARAQEFVGLKVKWRTTLREAHVKDGVISLMLLDRGNYPWVYCKVQERDYPNLIAAKQDDVVWVAGRISTLNAGVINLDEALLLPS